ncbi:MAG: class IV adenylate cyclase [Desulfovibrionaceae bacterium]|nr:class IV adenylate cyclase [Desulfovibrionaceae bacterium]
MALEMEIKYLGADHEAVRKALRERGARRLGRWFEDNLVLDDRARSLRAKNVLLRLRRSNGRVALTVKRPPQGPVPEGFKVLDEYETEVADFSALLRALEVLGFCPAFRYQKVREKWRLAGCDVCLDRLQFGDFVELEGPVEAMASAAAELGLAVLASSTETYHALNRQYRRDRGLDDQEDFVFEEDVRAELMADSS